MRRRVGPWLLAALTAAASGCAIRPESTPHDVTAERQQELLSPQPAEEGAVAAGDERIYLVAPGAQGRLRAVARATDGSAGELLRLLLDGPAEPERGRGFTTALPEGVDLRGVTVRGDVVDVDLGTDLAELPEQQLIVAIGQIVYTASQLVDDGPAQVLVRVEGDARSWPDGHGRVRPGPLTVYDYYPMAESSQPAYPQHAP